MNAVIYARYSSYNQTERSIEGQIEDCQRYASAVDMNIVGTYIDRAKSGTEAERRSDFQRMIKDSEKKTFDCVLVWKMDRFSRDRYDSAVYKAKLKKNGVRLISVNEPISDDPTGIILESLIEGMAEYYSANLSQNTRRGMRVARERGLWTGGHVPYGYAVQDHRLVVSEIEAPLIRSVFERFAAGDPLKAIVDDINAKGYRPRRGEKFTVNSFQSALRSEKYIGKYSVAGENYPDLYPRLIDDETFFRVQNRLDVNRRAPAKFKAKEDYLLQGKAFCGYCGAPLVGESGRSKNGTVHHYYACAKKKKEHTCRKLNEKKDYLEWYVTERACLYFTSPTRVDIISKAIADQYASEYGTDKINSLERQIEAIEQEIRDSVDLMVANARNKRLTDQLAEKIEDLGAKQDDMRDDLAKLKAASRSVLTESDCKKWLLSFRGGDNFDIKYRKRVIDSFINAIYLFDDKIVIYFCLDNGKQVSYMEMMCDLESVQTLPECSNSVRFAQPNVFKSEQLILRGILFGIILPYSRVK